MVSHYTKYTGYGYSRKVKQRYDATTDKLITTYSWQRNEALIICKTYDTYPIEMKNSIEEKYLPNPKSRNHTRESYQAGK